MDIEGLRSAIKRGSFEWRKHTLSRLAEREIAQRIGGCPTIAFCCDRLQTPSTALERPKYPQRSINYASGDFALSALSTKFSLALAANTILGQPPSLTGYSRGGSYRRLLSGHAFPQLSYVQNDRE